MNYLMLRGSLFHNLQAKGFISGRNNHDSLDLIDGMILLRNNPFFIIRPAWKC
jgi:hypothetical protein